MKLAFFRGLFLCGALGVASFSAAAWYEPASGIFVQKAGEGQCIQRALTDTQGQLQPDQDILLFIFGLSQSLGART